MAAETVSDLRKAFRSGKTKDIEYRIEQLTALKKLINENVEALTNAVLKDLGKCKTESMLFEIDMLETEIEECLKNIYKWTAPDYVSKTLMYKPMTCYINKDPLGVVLIIGAWNFPINLTLMPLIGAIVAGNCAIVKPSEISPVTADLLAEMVPKYLDQECYRVVCGGAKETTEILEERFDKIFYTGSGNVGKIAMTAAAKFLTPVVLELGGKNPAYVSDDADLEITANRIAWAKFTNCGQFCIAPDHIICSKVVQDKLANCLKESIESFYGTVVAKSPDYGRIVNERHFERIEALLEDNCEIFFGGLRDKDTLFFSPTILLNVSKDAKCMQDEIFGPILPIVTVESEEEALEFVNSRPKPLSLYLFTSSGERIRKWRNETSSGSFAANDCVIQGGLSTLPFGGVGPSGTGNYHGKFSFEAFTHQKSCLEAPLRLVEGANHRMRYPPYTERKLAWARWIIFGKGGSCNIL